MAGFVALTVISMPPDKLRLATVVLMFGVSLLAAYIDKNFLDGTFLAMETLPTVYIGYIAAAMAIGFVTLMLSRKAAIVIDDRFGERIKNFFESLAPGDRRKKNKKRDTGREK